MPIEGKLVDSMGYDALKVWLDFWELGGRVRADILKRNETGGDPEKMIPPEVTVTTVKSVCVVVTETGERRSDRSGEIYPDSIKAELIDCIRDGDRLKIGEREYEPDRIVEKDMGGFSVWIVDAHRVD